MTADASELQHDVLFSGDRGELSYDTRRVLVHLLQGPFVDGQRHSKLWPVLLRDETIIRRRLHDLFLDLVIDSGQEVAYIRQVDIDELEVPILLRRLPLTFIDSALMLFLRHRLTLADVHGDRATVSYAEMIEHLQGYERAGNVDKALFDRQVSKAVEKAKDHSLLSKLRGTEDRFEVSPTLKLVFSAEAVESLRKRYSALATQGEDEERAEDEP
jgi:hypothetical protein